MKTKIKPIIDFATESRLFLAGRYYTVEKEQAERFKAEGKALIQKVWFEDTVRCSQYQFIYEVKIWKKING